MDDDYHALVGRIRAAIEYVEPLPKDDLDKMLQRGVDSGLSLRETAKKFGTTVGRVRGAIRRRADSNG